MNSLPLPALELACASAHDAMLVFTSENEQNNQSWHGVYVNDAWFRLTGYDRHDVLGKSPSFLCHESESEALHTLEQTFFEGISTQIDIICRRKDESKFHNEMTVSFFEWDGHDYALCISRDISLKIMVQEQVYQESIMLYESNKLLREQAKKDALTGVYNRSVLKAEVESLFYAAKSTGIYFSLLFLDIDRFKQINDTYGHDAGDAALVHFSNVLQRELKRESDIVLRYGGEEFLLCCVGLDKNQSQQFAETLVNAVSRQPVVFDTTGTQIYLSASIGVACAIPTSDAFVSEYLLAADLAMYTAKAQGGSTVACSKKP